MPSLFLERAGILVGGVFLARAQPHWLDVVGRQKVKGQEALFGWWAFPRLQRLERPPGYSRLWARITQPFLSAYESHPLPVLIYRGPWAWASRPEQLSENYFEPLI